MHPTTVYNKPYSPGHRVNSLGNKKYLATDSTCCPLAQITSEIAPQTSQKTVCITVKILKFGTPQTIVIIVLKIEKFDVTLH